MASPQKPRYFSSIMKRCSFLFLAAWLMGLAYVPGALAGNEKTVALVMKALSNPFFLKMEAGARTYADGAGIPLEVFGMERETDVQKQVAIVENLVARRYGAIVLAPADSRLLIPACKEALEKGVVVVNIDNPLNPEALGAEKIRIPFVGPDNRAGAAKVGAYVKRKLKGRGRVMVIEGIRGVENAEQRREGFLDAATRSGGIRLVASASANWHTEEAFSLVVRLLKEQGPVDAIFCANDNMALGALQALDLEEMGGKVLLAGYDNIEAVREEMRKGRIHATVEQHPEVMGRLGVEMAWRALNGLSTPNRMEVPTELVTHESFGQRVALSLSDLDNPFFQSLLKGARQAAATHGIALQWAGAKNREVTQLRDVIEFARSGVQALILNPTDSEAVVPAVEMANQKGIPVITVDRKAAGGKVLSHIASDNVNGGTLAAGEVARCLGGEGDVVELEGIPGTSAAYDRGLGFNRALERFQGLRVVARRTANFDRTQAYRQVKGLLEEGVSFQAIFAHNDNMVLGAADALREASLLGSVCLVGFDAIPEAVAAVKVGMITSTVAQEPETMGRLSVQAVARNLRGEKIPGRISVPLRVIRR